MKRITLLFVFIWLITLQSCTVNEVTDEYDNDTISQVFEYSNVNLTNSNGYSSVLTYPFALYTSDMVLVYRLQGSGSTDVWKLLPETYYFDDGTLNFGYRNDFTRFDAEVNLYGFDLPGLNGEYRLNQVFRVVVIPANLNGKSEVVDFNDYNAVSKKYQLDKANVIKVQE